MNTYIYKIEENVRPRFMASTSPDPGESVPVTIPDIPRFSSILKILIIREILKIRRI